MTAQLLGLTEFVKLCSERALNYSTETDSFVIQCDSAFRVVKDASFISFGGANKSDSNDFRPTDAELQKIHSLPGTMKKYPREALKSYTAIVAGTDYDAHYERFVERALRSMAASIIGGPYMSDHIKSSDKIVGRVYDAAVRTIGGKLYLVEKVFILDVPENRDHIDGIESGINARLSVGAKSKRSDYFCDVCKTAMFGDDTRGSVKWCGHTPGMRLPDGTIAKASFQDAVQVELSRVWSGAQSMASFVASNKGNSGSGKMKQQELAVYRNVFNDYNARVKDLMPKLAVPKRNNEKKDETAVKSKKKIESEPVRQAYWFSARIGIRSAPLTAPNLCFGTTIKTTSSNK